MNHYDVIVLGAGASGLMCASEAAARGRKVMVLDHAARPGQKILVSGGGHSNFTNLDAKPSRYVSSNPNFVRYALSRFGPKNFLSLVKARHIPFHEKMDDQLFCDGSARAILELLLNRAREKGVQFLNAVEIQGVSFADGAFTVQASGTDHLAPHLVVATGGLSWPKLGSTDLGHRIARQFGLKVIEPSPGLVGLTFPERELERFKGLAGIHLRVGVSCGKWKSADDVMITHQGLSGPVILNASLVWEPGQMIYINWVSGQTVDDTLRQLKLDKAEGGRGQFRVWLSQRIPKRLAERLAWHAGARGSWAALPEGVLLQLAKDLHAYRFVPFGTFGYPHAEVTKGGVDTRELSNKTMESSKVPGLFFTGEVMDVTGQLGGYNLQWAWSSGFVAGRAV